MHLDVFEEKDPKIDDKIVFIDDHNENIKKIDLPAENCFKNDELDERRRKIEFNIEENGDLLQDQEKESEECIKEKHTKKNETIEINKNERNYISNGECQESEELWEILSSTSVTDEKIEVINFDESYNIIPDYFNNK